MSVEIAEAPATLNSESEFTSHLPEPKGDDGFNEFSYRPVPVVSAVGLILALISSIGIFVWMVMPLALVAALLSGVGLLTTYRSGGAYGGKGVGWSGVVMALGCFFGGIAFQVHMYNSEVPVGYQRVRFIQDISDKGFVEENGHGAVHPDIEALDGKKVFIKGFIYQTGQLQNLKSFLLVKDNDSCCFGANPKLEDRIGVYMTEGKGIEYKAGKVSIAGKFRINPKYDPHDDKAPIYIIEGEKFSSRVSDF